jgi:predicted transcriptional regulator
MTFRRPAEGFPMPLLGSACPLWPLYQALSRPGVPIRRILRLAGRLERRFDSYAFAETDLVGGFDGPVLTRSYMLVLPRAGAGEGADGSVVGTNCRICPAVACAARREASLLGTAAGAAPGISAFDSL